MCGEGASDLHGWSGRPTEKVPCEQGSEGGGGVQELYLEIFALCLLVVSTRTPPQRYPNPREWRPHLAHASVSGAQNGAQHIVGVQ